MRIPFVEDQPQQAHYTEKALREGRPRRRYRQRGKTGLFLATTEPYDVIVLDRMLPQVDGLTILRTLRASGSQVPILLLTALAEVDDRVEGLRAGADDYLGKPFSSAELLARVDAPARRRQAQPTEAATSCASAIWCSTASRAPSGGAAANSSTCSRANTSCSNT